MSDKSEAAERLEDEGEKWQTAIEGLAGLKSSTGAQKPTKTARVAKKKVQYALICQLNV